MVETGWDQAMDRIVERSRALLGSKGGGAFGFYTSGQLFSEEYDTLAVIGKGGIGTPHMDGNTRLCTATAGQALKESFGCDGQPASYTDVDHADTLFLVGHNVAATQTVLWSRMLDRRRGADLHLAVHGGTNLACSTPSSTSCSPTVTSTATGWPPTPSGSRSWSGWSILEAEEPFVVVQDAS
jgi:anaerobic selenocysteine-containing dehydrogenase